MARWGNDSVRACMCVRGGARGWDPGYTRGGGKNWGRRGSGRGRDEEKTPKTLRDCLPSWDHRERQRGLSLGNDTVMVTCEEEHLAAIEWRVDRGSPQNPGCSNLGQCHHRTGGKDVSPGQGRHWRRRVAQLREEGEAAGMCDSPVSGDGTWTEGLTTSSSRKPRSGRRLLGAGLLQLSWDIRWLVQGPGVGGRLMGDRGGSVLKHWGGAESPAGSRRTSAACRCPSPSLFC